MPEEKWRLLRQEQIAYDRFLKVYRGDYQLPGGKSLDGYLTLEEADSVHVVAVTPERDVLLVRQYRVGVDDSIYEVPAGFLEAAESDPLERARRELSEETGYASESWHVLGVVHSAVNRLRKSSHCFLALDAQPAGNQHLDSTESVGFERFALDEARRMVDRGEITSASTLGALFKAMLWMEHLGAA